MITIQIFQLFISVLFFILPRVFGLNLSSISSHPVELQM